jgi:hypothetical protein
MDNCVIRDNCIERFVRERQVRQVSLNGLAIRDVRSSEGQLTGREIETGDIVSGFEEPTGHRGT